ncbi:MAG: hypothetical protein ABSH20_23870 [Tepidisphaeraceae bacterium]|jgi:hypothetical protein
MESIATAADYADALLVARTARNWVFTLLLVMLLAQMGLFFAYRYWHALPADAPSVLHYALGGCGFLAMVLIVLLSLDMLLILHVMLVGRLIGVSHVTRAWLATVVLALLLFPWQAFLNNADLTATEFRIPGVIFTWEELVKYARFPTGEFKVAVLRWARFVMFPVLAIVLLFVIQSRASRGLRLALGEEKPAVQ